MDPIQFGAVVTVALVGYVSFMQWMRHQRRMMIHRERLAALEKGIELPPVEHEVQRRSWNVQRIILLAGLVWMSIGLTVFVVLSVLLTDPEVTQRLELIRGVQWVAIAPLGIGLAHLIVYAVGRKYDP